MSQNRHTAPMSNGFKSRKLWYAVGTSIAVVACAVGAALWPAFGVNFGEIIGGLLGSLAIYTGTNIGSKFVQGRRRYPGYGSYDSGYSGYGYQTVAPPANVQPIEEIEESIEE